MGGGGWGRERGTSLSHVGELDGAGPAQSQAAPVAPVAATPAPAQKERGTWFRRGPSCLCSICSGLGPAAPTSRLMEGMGVGLCPQPHSSGQSPR